MTSTWRPSVKINSTEAPPPDFHYNKEYGIRGRASPNILELISQLASTVIPNYYFNRQSQSYLLYLLNAAPVIDGHCVIKSLTINDLLTTK